MATETLPAWEETTDEPLPAWEDTADEPLPAWEATRGVDELKQETEAAGKAARREKFKSNLYGIGETVARAGNIMQPLREAFNYASGVGKQATDSALGYGQPGDFRRALQGERVPGAIRSDTILIKEIPHATPEDFQSVYGAGKDTAEVLSGLSEGAASLVNFFQTPEGIALWQSAKLPPAARAAAGGAISAEIANQAPHVIQQFQEAQKAGDKKGMANAAFNGLMTVAGTAGVTTMGAPEIKPVPPIPEPPLRNHAATIEAMRLAEKAQRQAEAGSPFTRATVPQEIISPGQVTAPLVPDMERVMPASMGGLPVNPLLPKSEPVSTLGTVQPPAPTMAPGEASGRAAQKLREIAAQEQRAAQFPQAIAEKVLQEQTQQPIHPDKPLTENQLRLIEDSLRKAISDNQGSRGLTFQSFFPGQEWINKLSDEAVAKLGEGIGKGWQWIKDHPELLNELMAVSGKSADDIRKAMIQKLPVKEIASQDDFRNPGQKLRMYNLLDDITDSSGKILKSKGSTVGEKSLNDLGFEAEPVTKGGEIVNEKTQGQTQELLVGSKLEEWANNQLKGKLLSPTPEDLAALAIKGAVQLEKGVTDFAKWSKVMTDAHGPEIKSHLKQIYEQSKAIRAGAFNVKPSVPQTQGAETSPATLPITKGAPEATVSSKATAKLPVQVDMEVTAEQLKIAADNIDQLMTRGNWTDELDVKLAKGRPADKRTQINVRIDEQIKSELVAAAKRVEELRRKAGQQADPVTQNLLKLEEEKMKIWLARFQESGRTWHDVGMSRQQMAKEMAQSSETLRNLLPQVKEQLPVLDQIWKDLRERQWAQAGRHFVDYLRMNLFTLGSWTLDFGTNLAAVASNLPAWLALDAAHLVTGKPAYRMATALRALQLSSKNMIPWADRFRMPQSIETELGTTAGGEFQGRGKEVMVDFSEILKNKPELAEKLKGIDRVIAAPVRMKRAVDNFFGRFGATSELFYRAYTQGRKQGLKGDALREFVDKTVANPPAEMSARAVKIGKEFKFNRDLMPWEERFSNNLITKLVVEAFPRWALQFTRWAGEMIGVNPSFFKEVASGKATPESVITYLSKAATGWGAIYAFNQLVYDDIDANTMEHVDEAGNRTRLSGRTPAPELFFVCALLRGDMDKAKAALSQISIPGAKLLSGDPAGLISPLVDTIRESIRGRYTAERTAAELTKLVNDAFPGKSVLGFIRALFDPSIREGVGAPLPGVSALLPQRANPTTGEPLAPKQRVPGTGFEFPTVGGTPFPGAVRVLNDVEKALTTHGLALTRPRRTSLIELPPEDVPADLRREYEVLAGRNVKRIVGEGIRNPEWKKAPFEIRREILSDWLQSARESARSELSEKYGKSMETTKSTPRNIELLPKKLRQ